MIENKYHAKRCYLDRRCSQAFFADLFYTGTALIRLARNNRGQNGYQSLIHPAAQRSSETASFQRFPQALRAAADIGSSAGQFARIIHNDSPAREQHTLTNDDFSAPCGSPHTCAASGAATTQSRLQRRSIRNGTGLFLTTGVLLHGTR